MVVLVFLVIGGICDLFCCVHDSVVGRCRFRYLFYSSCSRSEPLPSPTLILREARKLFEDNLYPPELKEKGERGKAHDEGDREGVGCRGGKKGDEEWGQQLAEEVDPTDVGVELGQSPSFVLLWHASADLGDPVTLDCHCDADVRKGHHTSDDHDDGECNPCLRGSIFVVAETGRLDVDEEPEESGAGDHDGSFLGKGECPDHADAAGFVDQSSDPACKQNGDSGATEAIDGGREQCVWEGLDEVQVESELARPSVPRARCMLSQQREESDLCDARTRRRRRLICRLRRGGLVCRNREIAHRARRGLRGACIRHSRH